MAIIKCKNCGKEISDKASKCVHCGEKMVKEAEKKFCNECGNEIDDKILECQNCGSPIEENILKNNEIKKKEKKKKVIITIVCVILLIGACSVNESYKQKQEEIAAQQEAEQYEQEYQKALNVFYKNIKHRKEYVEFVGGMLINIWHNSIYKVSDKDTDEYTKNNGSFVSDFNDALKKFINSDIYKGIKGMLEMQTEELDNALETVKNPPSGFEEQRQNAIDVYNSYNVLKNDVLSPQGNLESYINGYKQHLDDLNTKLNNLKQYVTETENTDDNNSSEETTN